MPSESEFESEPQVILVDSQDQPCGYADKLAAHQQGLLHRAFSVLLYRYRDGQLEVLLQQRESGKYHCGGLWTNTCCSHPLPGEEALAAAERRLGEELGIGVCALQFIGKFEYSADFSNGLSEHELDYVFIGEYDQPLDRAGLNPQEVADIAWRDIQVLEQQLLATSEIFTPWLPLVMDVFKSYLKTNS